MIAKYSITFNKIFRTKLKVTKENHMNELIYKNQISNYKTADKMIKILLVEEKVKE